MSNIPSIAGGIRYQCTADSGALLLLRDPADRTELNCKLHIRQYIVKNIESWKAFANDHLGIGLLEKDILFVSGFTKTTVWAATSFSDHSASGELSISGGPFSSIACNFRVSISNGTTTSISSRVGPANRLGSQRGSDSEPDSPAELPRDQCIFLNFYRSKRRMARWPTSLRGGADPSNLDFDGPDEDEASGLTFREGSSCDTVESENDSTSATQVRIHAEIGFLLSNKQRIYRCTILWVLFSSTFFR